jgi:hypothetical protein
MDVKTGFIQFYFDGTTLDGILSVNADWKEIEAGKTLVGLRKDFADPSIVGDQKRTLKSIIKETENRKGRVAHP